MQDRSSLFSNRKGAAAEPVTACQKTSPSVFWDKDCLFIAGLYNSSHVGLLTLIRPGDSDNDNNSLCHQAATPRSGELWHLPSWARHASSSRAKYQPRREKKPQRVKIPTPWNCQFIDVRIYFTGVLGPWSRGCCWRVSLTLKFSLLPTGSPCRAWIHARVWNSTLQRNLPWRAASCTAAMHLGSTKISWDWEHKEEENPWNACGVSLFLLHTIGARWKCEAMAALTHWLFGTSSLQVEW